jgi:hypothetical protein
LKIPPEKFFLEPLTLKTSNNALMTKRRRSIPKKVFIAFHLMVMGNGVCRIDIKKKRGCV